jgi:hypothetical protein
MSDPVTPPANPTQDPAQPDPQAGKTFTQEHVTRIATEQKQEGKAAAIAEVAQRLGMSIEDAEKVLAAAKKAEDEKKDELQKVQEERDRIQRERESEKATDAQEKHDLRVRLELIRAGVPLPEDETEADEALEQLVRLVSAKTGATLEEIRTDIGKTKTRFPNLFESSTTPPTPAPTPSALPSGKPQQTSAGKSGLETGAELARQQAAQRGVKTAS